jgi:PHD/YefM family antitoxin component YafN of YafNO toxin-antitoxin module
MTKHITIHKLQSVNAAGLSSLVHVTALQIRQSFGKILKKLQKDDEPILVEKGREPVAVLISLKAFQERFIDYREKKKREALLELAKTSAKKSTLDSLTVLRELRYGSDH